jgi:hypothetical protein
VVAFVLESTCIKRRWDKLVPRSDCEVIGEELVIGEEIETDLHHETVPCNSSRKMIGGLQHCLWEQTSTMTLQNGFEKLEHSGLSNLDLQQSNANREAKKHKYLMSPRWPLDEVWGAKDEPSTSVCSNEAHMGKPRTCSYDVRVENFCINFVNSASEI